MRRRGRESLWTQKAGLPPRDLGGEDVHFCCAFAISLTLQAAQGKIPHRSAGCGSHLLDNNT